MKKIIIKVLTVIFIVTMSTCATTGGGSGDTLSLLEAVEQSAEKIAEELAAGSRVAVVAFESDSENLSQFIMEELVGALHDRRIEVADRENLPYLERELNFQLSGAVSDESMQSIGKFLGAELVISGQMRHLGNTYRFTANAIRVETAVHASIPRLNVRNDRDLQSMITALNNQTTVVRQARYTVPEIPQTAGTFLDRGIRFAMQGEYDKAIADFTEALRLNPNMVGAYIMRGRALRASVLQVNVVLDNFSYIDGIFILPSDLTAEQLRIYNMAITDLTQALRLDPDNASTYHELGEVRTAIGDVDRAITDYTQAIRIAPNNVLSYLSRGFAYYLRATLITNSDRDIDRAVADFTEAIRLYPNSSSGYSYRGFMYTVMYTTRGRNNEYLDRAVADFEVALRIDPNAPFTRRWLEDALLKRGR